MLARFFFGVVGFSGGSGCSNHPWGAPKGAAYLARRRPMSTSSPAKIRRNLRQDGADLTLSTYQKKGKGRKGKENIPGGKGSDNKKARLSSECRKLSDKQKRGKEERERGENREKERKPIDYGKPEGRKNSPGLGHYRRKFFLQGRGGTTLIHYRGTGGKERGRAGAKEEENALWLEQGPEIAREKKNVSKRKNPKVVCCVEGREAKNRVLGGTKKDRLTRRRGRTRM